MDIDTYLENVQRLAQITEDQNVAAIELIESPGVYASLVTPSIVFRESQLTGSEEQELGAWLEFGFFSNRSPRERLAAFAMSSDVRYEAERLRVRRCCEPYRQEQVLFRNVPALFDNIRRKVSGKQDFELIDVRAVRLLLGSEIYRAGTGFAKLCPYLAPSIVNWAHTEWSSKPIYVRLDANKFFTDQPLDQLEEETLVPANPGWLKDFSLRKRMKNFAAYVLQDCSVPEGVEEFLVYHDRHIRRLEVHVERREDDYLSMMIEELPRADDPNGLMIGRCIHLDTRDPVFTPLGSVEIQHLDLAINVYEGADRQRRFDKSLQHGKAQDATYRTHLLRIEGISFLSVFRFCKMFLQSQKLLNEWVTEVGASTFAIDSPTDREQP